MRARLHSEGKRSIYMKAVVGANGVLIPRRMLRGIKEVQIRKDGRTIVVEPAPREADPIFELGKTPVTAGVDDASEHHDRYLYRGS
jgi:virulence-associated protein VagC